MSSLLRTLITNKLVHRQSRLRGKATIKGVYCVVTCSFDSGNVASLSDYGSHDKKGADEGQNFFAGGSEHRLMWLP